MTKTVKHLLAEKGSFVFSLPPDASVFQAIEMMAERSVGALLVMDGQTLRGIISERDYARKVILKGKQSRQTPVRDIMTTTVTCVVPERTVEECMALMTDKRIRHLPVVEDSRVVGIISIGDVVRAVISDKEFVIQQLEKYITSGG
jgi:CBS domain-containing protein